MQMKVESQFCIEVSGSCCLTWFQADKRRNTVVSGSVSSFEFTLETQREIEEKW